MTNELKIRISIILVIISFAIIFVSILTTPSENGHSGHSQDIVIPYEPTTITVMDPDSDYDYDYDYDYDSDPDSISTNQITHLTISAAGDVTLGGDERWLGYHYFMRVFEENNRDFSYFFRNVRHIFEESDLSIVNLEGALTYETAHLDLPFVFRAPPSFARILTYGAVDVVTVANNHTGDFFEIGYQDTLDALRAENIAYFGNDKNTILEVNGINVGLFGFLMWSDGAEHRANIVSAINDLHERGAQLIIAYHHWGIMQENMAAQYQRDLGQFTLDRGADLVLGSHPHVIQGIERYNGRFIVHSLADFCYGGHSHPPDHDAFIFQQTFTFVDGVLQHTEDINIIPVMMSSIRAYNNFQPTIADYNDAVRIKERLRTYSGWLNSELYDEMFLLPSH